ncbi:hypothetical protein SWPG_00172 [Synechococcus phage S-CBM2]|nr:hypothetical protein SWPG_00172 [Synechococcus phage S-CBM2]
MLEILLATAIVSGKVEIAPNTYQYDFLTQDHQSITRVVYDQSEHFCELN